MAPRETENNFGVTNNEHYGILWYFLEWSIVKWGEKILQGMRGSTHNTFPEPHVPVFNNLLNR